ncbi:hypothetical protein KPSA1_04009 [Pseudomonas syringae pv. actinidiae]|uniref:Uncharacterized protein n=1 Tax=Pseudomonas syringae pv. actinidiae TaxID=103796 RepID=A0A2V0QC44_PSESF|nr:hypothetical protein KPSA1_04009 [Pseudomonas syringae pv. actinidiae]
MGSDCGPGMTLCCSTDTTIVRRSASHAVLDALRPILSMRRRSVARSITLRFCDVSDVCLRLKSPFRPSATDFEGSK